MGLWFVKIGEGNGLKIDEMNQKGAQMGQEGFLRLGRVGIG